MKEMILEEENVHGTLVLNIHKLLCFSILLHFWLWVHDGASTFLRGIILSFVVISNWAPILYWLSYFYNFQGRLFKNVLGCIGLQWFEFDAQKQILKIQICWFSSALLLKDGDRDTRIFLNLTRNLAWSTYHSRENKHKDSFSTR